MSPEQGNRIKIKYFLYKCHYKASKVHEKQVKLSKNGTEDLPFGLISLTLCGSFVKGCPLTPRNRVSRKKASAEGSNTGMKVVAFFEADLRVMAYKGLILAVLRNSVMNFGKERLCLT